MEELLFIYLLSNDHQREHHVVLESITQRGIKAALGCDLGHISRLLNKNIINGYISKKLLKIKNQKRKQNAYFLTEEGLSIAIELNNLNMDSNDK